MLKNEYTGSSKKEESYPAVGYENSYFKGSISSFSLESRWESVVGIASINHKTDAQIRIQLDMLSSLYVWLQM